MAGGRRLARQTQTTRSAAARRCCFRCWPGSWPSGLVEVAPAPGRARSQTATPTTTAARSWATPRAAAAGLPTPRAGADTPRRLRWCGAAASTCPGDPHDPDAVRCLECCVWPDQPERLARLRAAVGRPDRPAGGGARWPAGVGRPRRRRCPSDAKVVVSHTAALVCVSEPGRERFAELTAQAPNGLGLGRGPGVVPALAASWGQCRHPGRQCSCSGGDRNGWLGWPSHAGHGCNGSTLPYPPPAPTGPSWRDRAQRWCPTHSSQHPGPSEAVCSRAALDLRARHTAGRSRLRPRRVVVGAAGWR
jgi:Uncharacterized protein conserved in bacteria (DUF2332)